MINGQLSVMERPAAIELSQQEVDGRFLDMAARVIDHVTDHAQDYMAAFEMMNTAFTSLSADTNDGYNKDQLSALTASSRVMTTLSADEALANSRRAVNEAYRAEQNHFVHNVLLKEEDTKKRKKSDLSLAA